MSEKYSLSDFDRLLRRELRLLELLLDDPGLASLRVRAPAHPAVRRYEETSHFLSKSHKLHYPDELDHVLEIGNALLDGMTIAPDVSPEELVAAIDDAEVLRQLRSRMADPHSFSDQMAAFTCWNLLRSNGVRAHLVEQEGLPDIAVSIASGSREWIECKRIRLGTEPGRVRKVISKANSQIKHADPEGAGFVYLFIERPQNRVTFDDTLPDIVEAYRSEVERELGSGHSRSVAAVILGWDDHMFLGNPPDRTMHFLRRRSVLLPHRMPRRRLELPHRALSLSRTIEMLIVWSASTEERPGPKAIRQENVVVTELFRRECELPGDVRAVHAIEAIRRPDGVVSYDLGGVTMVLATKWIAVAAKPYMILLFASVREGGPTEIQLGFRVYSNDDGITKDTHPLDVFMRLLARYGLAVTVGNQEGLFAARAQVEISDRDTRQLVRVNSQSGEPFVLSSMFKINETAPATADVAWAFAISAQRYRADIKKHRR